MASRIQRGGVSIGAGGDGCVFDEVFDSSGNITPGVTGFVTKVFPTTKTAAADREYALVAKVQNVLGKDAPGVVLSTSLTQLPTVKDTISHGNACAELDTEIRAGKTPFPAIVQPRALHDLDSSPYPASFYKRAYDALTALNSAGIVHLDIARRNVFVVKGFECPEFKVFGERGKCEMAAIGDFGSILDLADPKRKEAVTAYAQKFGFDSVESCLNKDGSTFSANICIAIEVLQEYPEKLVTFKRDLASLSEPASRQGAISSEALKSIGETNYRSEVAELIDILTTRELMPEEYVALTNAHCKASDRRMLTILMIKNRSSGIEAMVADAWKPISHPAILPRIAGDLLARRLARLRKGGVYWPLKYHRGLTRKQNMERKRSATRRTKMSFKNPKAYVPWKTDKGVKTRRSSYSSRFHSKYPEAKTLPEIAKATGVSLPTLKTVYDRGMAAWRTGHRPGASQHAWGMARVHSFVLHGKTWRTADKDLATKK